MWVITRHQVSCLVRFAQFAWCEIRIFKALALDLKLDLKLDDLKCTQVESHEILENQLKILIELTKFLIYSIIRTLNS